MKSNKKTRGRERPRKELEVNELDRHIVFDRIL